MSTIIEVCYEDDTINHHGFERDVSEFSEKNPEPEKLFTKSNEKMEDKKDAELKKKKKVAVIAKILGKLFRNFLILMTYFPESKVVPASVVLFAIGYFTYAAICYFESA